MIKLLIKIGIYGLLVFILMEGYVRIFHLHSDTPLRYIDEYGVEKRIPNQKGVNITGNRKQHATAFQINSFGFNTLREKLEPTNKYKIGLVGDSFIEGFHQDYNYSIGKMIESKIDTLEVYEFGCGGYDMADQLHLIEAYQDRFAKMDKIILYLKYENDLARSSYKPNHGRISSLNGKVATIRRESKFLNYIGGLGIINKFSRFLKNRGNYDNSLSYPKSDDEEFENMSISNFQKLLKEYNFKKDKFVFLLDTRKTSSRFIEYCKNNNIRYIDFAENFDKAQKETTLIYDEHWNTYGRELIAKSIVTSLENSQF